MPDKTPEDIFSKPEDQVRALLEKNFIDEFLKNKGHDRASLKRLPEEEARRLMTEASIYACGKLTEIETKARFKEHFKEGSGS
jgi:hypothetical protein